MITKQKPIKEKVPTPKETLRRQLATNGTIGALEAHENRHPGQCVVKNELIPNIIRRVAWLMEENYDPRYDQLAIPVPTYNYIKLHWSAICLLAAEEHNKYIVWEVRRGVRLGTFEEWSAIPATKLFPIVEGVVKNGKQRARIIGDQGGDCMVLEASERLLSSGQEQDTPPENNMI